MTVWRTQARWFAMLRQVTTILLVQDGVSLGSSDHWVASRNTSLTAHRIPEVELWISVANFWFKVVCIEWSRGCLQVFMWILFLLPCYMPCQCTNSVFSKAFFFSKPERQRCTFSSQSNGQPSFDRRCREPRRSCLGLDLNGIRVLDDGRAWLLLWWPGAWHQHHQHHDDERGLHGNRHIDLDGVWLFMGLRWQWFHRIRHVRWQLWLQSVDGSGHEDVGRLWSSRSCVRCLQMTFAIISSAIISGSLVERMRFSAYCIMLALWSLLIYAPLCHWVWALAAGLVRWELWTLRVELWFTSAPVCPALLPVASLDHAGTWRRIWALPTSLSWSWVAASFGSAGWDSTAVLLCPSQMSCSPCGWPPLLWLRPHPCWHGWPLSESWRARLPVSVHLLVLLQARCSGGRDVFHGFWIVFTDPQFHCRLPGKCHTMSKIGPCCGCNEAVVWCVLLELIVQFCKCVQQRSETL